MELPPDARYLAKDVAAAGDAACKDVAAERADGIAEVHLELRVAHPGAVGGRASGTGTAGCRRVDGFAGPQ